MVLPSVEVNIFQNRSPRIRGDQAYVWIFQKGQLRQHSVALRQVLPGPDHRQVPARPRWQD